MARRARVVGEFELEEVRGRSGPGAAAERAAELLAAGTLPEHTSRAQLLVEYAGYLNASGDTAAAERAYRDAVADSGDTIPDARLHLARHLWERGAVPGCDALLAEVWVERPTDPFAYVWAAELLEERDDLAGALRWANTGAFRLMRNDAVPDGLVVSLLVTRRRIRMTMGFPEDEYDIAVAPTDLPYFPGAADGSVRPGAVLATTRLGSDGEYEYHADLVVD